MAGEVKIPIEEFDYEPICAKCEQGVYVREGHEFNEGDLCHDCLTHEYPAMKLRAEAAEREVERLKGETVKLRDAYRHYQSVKQQGKSEFIKENGRFGGSPWAELCDAISLNIAADAKEQT